MTQTKRHTGMTLVEILVVVSLMAVLGTAVAMAVVPRMQDARIKATQADARTLRTAAQSYLIDSGVCPGSVDLLRAEGYLDRASRRTDAWGGELHVSCGGGGIDVRSPGPDGELGTEDDIVVPDAPA
ncbi:MAG: type II secretion system protein [Myxococcota bacterium]